MTQPQLFTNPATPKPPPDTREIARRRTGTKKRDILRALMRSLLEDGGYISADAWAIERGYSILAVRPRVAELKKAGLIFRRDNTGRTLDGNAQERFGLTSRIWWALQDRLYKDWMEIDAAIDETLTRAGL